MLELYYKGVEQLTESLLPTVIQALHRRLQGAGSAGISRVLLTYKGRPSALDNPADCAALRAALPPEVAVSAVWSAKNAYAPATVAWERASRKLPHPSTWACS